MNRAVVVGAGLVAILSPYSATAATPSVANSSIALSGNVHPCQFTFRLDGSVDQMMVTVTVKDADNVACPSCVVVVSVSGTTLTGPGNFCTCCPAQAVVTDVSGVAVATFSKIGGAGTLEVNAVACGSVALTPAYSLFTSNDLDGTCEPLGAQTIVDDALLALGRAAPHQLWVDYDCDGDFDVIDLGWYSAGGLAPNGVGCASSVCP